jgi:hypothetical protein
VELANRVPLVRRGPHRDVRNLVTNRDHGWTLTNWFWDL